MKKQLQLQKQLSSEFHVGLSETQRLVDQRDSAHRDSLLVRQKNTNMRKTIDGEAQIVEKMVVNFHVPQEQEHVQSCTGKQVLEVPFLKLPGGNG